MLEPVDELVRRGDLDGLAALMEPTEKKALRWHATVGLGRTEDPAALPLLVAALGERKLRLPATEALGLLGGDEAATARVPPSRGSPARSPPARPPG